MATTPHHQQPTPTPHRSRRSRRHNRSANNAPTDKLYATPDAFTFMLVAFLLFGYPDLSQTTFVGPALHSLCDLFAGNVELVDEDEVTEYDGDEASEDDKDGGNQQLGDDEEWNDNESGYDGDESDDESTNGGGEDEIVLPIEYPPISATARQHSEYALAHPYVKPPPPVEEDPEEVFRQSEARHARRFPPRALVSDSEGDHISSPEFWNIQTLNDRRHRSPSPSVTGPRAYVFHPDEIIPPGMSPHWDPSLKAGADPTISTVGMSVSNKQTTNTKEPVTPTSEPRVAAHGLRDDTNRCETTTPRSARVDKRKREADVDCSPSKRRASKRREMSER